MDSIANETLCGYFYIFYLVFAVFAAISVLGGIWMFMSTKMPVGHLLLFLFNILLSFGISATSALFLYLICERALKPAAAAEGRSRRVTSQYDLF